MDNEVKIEVIGDNSNEPKNKDKKGSSAFLVVFLVLVILGLCGYIAYDKFFVKETREDVEEKDVDKSNKSSKVYSVSDADKLLVKFGFKDTGFVNEIYEYGYTDQYKMYVAIKNVDTSKIKEVECTSLVVDGKGTNGVCPSNKTTTSVISYDDVNKIYKSMYGTDMPKSGINLLNLGHLYYVFYDYVEKESGFAKLECGGCGGTYGPAIKLNKVKSATIDGDKLVIDVYYAYSEQVQNGNTYTYKIGSSVDAYFEFEGSLEEAQKLLDNTYYSKADVYQVVFKKVNDNYQFVSVNKLLD